MGGAWWYSENRLLKEIVLRLIKGDRIREEGIDTEPWEPTEIERDTEREHLRVQIPKTETGKEFFLITQIDFKTEDWHLNLKRKEIRKGISQRSEIVFFLLFVRFSVLFKLSRLVLSSFKCWLSLLFGFVLFVSSGIGLPRSLIPYYWKFISFCPSSIGFTGLLPWDFLFYWNLLLLLLFGIVSIAQLTALLSSL